MSDRQNDPPTSHDQNFKNLILDYPRQALELFSPTEAMHLHKGVTIKPIRQEQLKHRLGNRFRELDVPLLVEWPGGQRDAVLFALEEETNPMRFNIRRLIDYCLDLAELYQTTRVVPVVIFLNASSGITESLQLGSDTTTYLNFHYISCVLPELKAEDYWHSTNIVARLCLSLMHWQKQQKLEVYARATRGLTDLEPDLNKQIKYLDFIDIYTSLTDNERSEYRKKYPEESTQMITLTERLTSEGIQRGQRIGESGALKRQIRGKFGSLPGWAETRIDTANSAQLEAWLDAIITAETLDFLSQ